MYFLINHDTGIVESADTTESALNLIDAWIESGTDEDDISLYQGTRRNFGIKTYKKSYAISTFKTDKL